MRGGGRDGEPMKNKASEPECYGRIRKRDFLAMNLGPTDHGTIRVVAGNDYRWWDWMQPNNPIIVEARILTEWMVGR